MLPIRGLLGHIWARHVDMFYVGGHHICFGRSTISPRNVGQSWKEMGVIIMIMMINNNNNSSSS